MLRKARWKLLSTMPTIQNLSKTNSEWVNQIPGRFILNYVDDRHIYCAVLDVKTAVKNFLINAHEFQNFPTPPDLPLIDIGELRSTVVFQISIDGGCG